MSRWCDIIAVVCILYHVGVWNEEVPTVVGRSDCRIIISWWCFPLIFSKYMLNSKTRLDHITHSSHVTYPMLKKGMLSRTVCTKYENCTWNSCEDTTKYVNNWPLYRFKDFCCVLKSSYRRLYTRSCDILTPM